MALCLFAAFTDVAAKGRTSARALSPQTFSQRPYAAAGGDRTPLTRRAAKGGCFALRAKLLSLPPPHAVAVRTVSLRFLTKRYFDDLMNGKHNEKIVELFLDNNGF